MCRRRSCAARPILLTRALLILLSPALLRSNVLCRRRSCAAHPILLTRALLILLSRALLRSNVLCRRRSCAARPILLSHALLRNHVLLWSGVAAAAPRRCRARSTARPALPRHVFARGRLRNPRSIAAAPSGHLRLLLPVPCRSSWAARRRGRLLRRSAWRSRARRGSLRRRMSRRCDLRRGAWCRCLRSGCRTRGGCGVRCRSRARRGCRLRRGRSRATAPGRRSSSSSVLLCRRGCRHCGGNDETCRDPRRAPLEHGTTSCAARATQRASRRAGFAVCGANLRHIR